MTQVIQSIRNIGMLLFGVVMIATGYKVNDARRQAQAEVEAANARALEIAEQARAQEAADRARAAEEAAQLAAKGAAQKKPKTKIEKAKPEMASATQQDVAAKPEKASATKSNGVKRQKPFE